MATKYGRGTAMTIGELYGVIEDLLERHNQALPMVEISRFVCSVTNASNYDIVAAMNALVRAGRLELVDGPDGAPPNAAQQLFRLAS